MRSTVTPVLIPKVLCVVQGYVQCAVSKCLTPSFTSRAMYNIEGDIGWSSSRYHSCPLSLITHQLGQRL
ncbi:Postsynaptic protein-related isoform 2 [Theobroma cacao]|uniref:Postsynaptic protein-related isoform 2 n=1 Tax=Theobroma cacao TaxID=3641 RepID=A0A061GHI2_THECC|nr:Postsynaptic protein-related isoform 2 [Theobroma cacao]